MSENTIRGFLNTFTSVISTVFTIYDNKTLDVPKLQTESLMLIHFVLSSCEGRLSDKNKEQKTPNPQQTKIKRALLL